MAKPKRIFYTDDDADDQELFREVLDSIDGNFELFSQYHGKELLDVLQTPPPSPDIVFLDLNMPHKNGYEALEEIRADEKLKSLPIVVFSTSDSAEVIETCRNLGANLYVSKPPSFPALKATLSSVLSLDWATFKSSNFRFTIN